MNAPTAADPTRVPLLAAPTSAELQEAAALFTVHRDWKGAILVSEGARLEVLNFLLSGLAKFHRQDEEGRQLDITTVVPGEQLLLRHPKPAVAFIGRLVKRFRGRLEATRVFAMEDVHGRVTQFLLSQADRDRAQGNISRAMLASILPARAQPAVPVAQYPNRAVRVEC